MRKPVLPMGANVAIKGNVLNVVGLETSEGSSVHTYVLADVGTGERVRFSHPALCWLVRNGSALLMGDAAGLWPRE